MTTNSEELAAAQEDVGNYLIRSDVAFQHLRNLMTGNPTSKEIHEYEVFHTRTLTVHDLACKRRDAWKMLCDIETRLGNTCHKDLKTATDICQNIEIIWEKLLAPTERREIQQCRSEIDNLLLQMEAIVRLL